jgi:hypothetical protein
VGRSIVDLDSIDDSILTFIYVVDTHGRTDLDASANILVGESLSALGHVNDFLAVAVGDGAARFLHDERLSWGVFRDCARSCRRCGRRRARRGFFIGGNGDRSAEGQDGDTLVGFLEIRRRF